MGWGQSLYLMLSITSVLEGCHAELALQQVSVVAPSELGFSRNNGKPGIWWANTLKAPRMKSYPNPLRPTEAAVASTTSHLSAGRSASGFLENCLEAGLKTFGAYVSGSITGFVFGGIGGGTISRVPNVSLLKSMRMKACRLGGDWGELTAAFTAFSSFSTIIRGRNDKWDQVIGACGAGAYLNRAKGPAGMIQGASIYGMFSLVFAAMDKNNESDVVDVPVDSLEKKR